MVEAKRGAEVARRVNLPRPLEWPSRDKMADNYGRPSRPRPDCRPLGPQASPHQPPQGESFTQPLAVPPADAPAPPDQPPQGRA